MHRLASIAAILVLGAGCTNEFSLSMASDAAAAVDARTGASSVSATPASTSSTTTTSTTSSTSTTSTVPAAPLTLAFAGDVHMIGSMSARDPLGAVTDLLSAPDLTFVNLETVVGTAEEVGRAPIDKKFIFRSPPETLDHLAAAGVDVVGLANNHTWDHGPRGAAVTRARVDASPLTGVGAGADPATAYAPAHIEVNGRTIGVVSLTRVPCDWSREAAAERPEIAWACDRFAIAAIAAITSAETDADFTVVLVHGGTEMSDCPDDRLREVVDAWVELGVDVIAFSHPHVLQGVEMIDGAAVLWSTGNFAFSNRGGRTGRSAIFEVTVGERVEQVRVVPTVLPGGVAAPAADPEAALVRTEVSERSVGGRITDNGVLVPDAGISSCG